MEKDANFLGVNKTLINKIKRLGGVSGSRGLVKFNPQLIPKKGWPRLCQILFPSQFSLFCLSGEESKHLYKEEGKDIKGKRGTSGRKIRNRGG